MSGTHNIVAEQGATFHFNFTVKTNDVVWNLSTYSARMQVRNSTASTTKLLDLSSPTDIVLTSLGHVSVTVNATTMAALPFGRWVYDLELESAGGEVTRLLEGRFIVTPEVTI
jgi:hypothetical protein